MLHIPEMQQLDPNVVDNETLFAFDTLPPLYSTNTAFFSDVVFFSNETTDRNSGYIRIAELLNEILSLYYIPVLAISGTIGNILSMVVFFKTKLKKLSSSYYLAALAVSDTCYLLCLWMQWVNFIGVETFNRTPGCQFFSFLTYLSSFLSVWFVVAFTVERFVAVIYPLKRQSMCTVRRAKMVLAGLFVVGCIHSSPVIYFAMPMIEEPGNNTVCEVRYKTIYTMYNYVDTTIVLAIPLTAIVVLNTITGCTVWKFATVRRTMTTHKRKSQINQTYSLNGSTRNNNGKQQQTAISPSCTHPNGRNSISQNGSSKSNRAGKFTNSSQIKVTKMLLIVSTVFVCLNLPSYVVRVMIFLENEYPIAKSTVVLQYICWFLFMTNFGINFVLYCLSGQNFRRAVISLFRKTSSSTNAREGLTQVTEGPKYFTDTNEERFVVVHGTGHSGTTRTKSRA